MATQQIGILKGFRDQLVAVVYDFLRTNKNELDLDVLQPVDQKRRFVVLQEDLAATPDALSKRSLFASAQCKYVGQTQVTPDSPRAAYGSDFKIYNPSETLAYEAGDIGYLELLSGIPCFIGFKSGSTIYDGIVSLCLGDGRYLVTQTHACVDDLLDTSNTSQSMSSEECIPCVDDFNPLRLAGGTPTPNSYVVYDVNVMPIDIDTPVIFAKVERGESCAQDQYRILNAEYPLTQIQIGQKHYAFAGLELEPCGSTSSSSSFSSSFSDSSTSESDSSTSDSDPSTSDPSTSDGSDGSDGSEGSGGSTSDLSNSNGSYSGPSTSIRSTSVSSISTSFSESVSDSNGSGGSIDCTQFLVDVIFDPETCDLTKVYCDMPVASSGLGG